MWASQPGSPAAATLERAGERPLLLLAGNNHRRPKPHQTRAQRAMPPASPSGPSAAAGAWASRGARLGQTSNPMAR